MDKDGSEEIYTLFTCPYEKLYSFLKKNRVFLWKAIFSLWEGE